MFHVDDVQFFSRKERSVPTNNDCTRSHFLPRKTFIGLFVPSTSFPVSYKLWYLELFPKICITPDRSAFVNRTQCFHKTFLLRFINLTERPDVDRHQVTAVLIKGGGGIICSSYVGKVAALGEGQELNLGKSCFHKVSRQTKIISVVHFVSHFTQKITLPYKDIPEFLPWRTCASTHQKRGG